MTTQRIFLHIVYFVKCKKQTLIRIISVYYRLHKNIIILINNKIRLSY